MQDSNTAFTGVISTVFLAVARDSISAFNTAVVAGLKIAASTVQGSEAAMIRGYGGRCRWWVRTNGWTCCFRVPAHLGRPVTAWQDGPLDMKPPWWVDAEPTCLHINGSTGPGGGPGWRRRRQGGGRPQSGVGLSRPDLESIKNCVNFHTFRHLITRWTSLLRVPQKHQ